MENKRKLQTHMILTVLGTVITLFGAFRFNITLSSLGFGIIIILVILKFLGHFNPRIRKILYE